MQILAKATNWSIETESGVRPPPLEGSETAYTEQNIEVVRGNVLI